MVAENSCIVAQFRRHAELTDEEVALLKALEKDVRDFPAGTVLSEAGIEAGSFFSLHSGWACATRLLSDGQRQVLDIFLAGQVMGLRDIGFSQTQTELTALTDVSACPFPTEYLDEIFERSPRLARIFFLKLVRENALLTERIINIGRRPAAQRLAHFLLEMKVRLHVAEPEFELPLNQNVIADALGISAVHVSRTLAQLKGEGLVRVGHNRVMIDDLDGLVDLSGFDPAYLE
ncbi:MAG: helix-turn-helix domain-containing protein [Gammaproteobacteria bacterium]|nr:helix-turn-helix domain-containing protein [Gammaproteobacteria bacterium]